MANTTENNADVDERLSALLTNASAIRAIAGAVENTLGPKGMDTMLVDSAGNIIVTNAGVTILDSMEVTHPAARMLINIARNQHRQAGDGTTTATIMAGTLVNEGLNHVMKGVPVSRIIDGINDAVDYALELLAKEAVKVKGLEDPLLRKAALIAGRGDEKITDAVIGLAKSIGDEKLRDKSFRLSDRIIYQVGMEHELFDGLLLKKRRQNDHMPVRVENAGVIVFNDALMPEELSEAAIRTDAGFAAYTEYQEKFRRNLIKFKEMGIKLVVVAKGMDAFAEDFFTANDIMAVSRIYGKQLLDLLEFTGAKPLRRNSLDRSPDELKKYLGFAEAAEEIREYGHIRIAGGAGAKTSTFVAGATTEEIALEKERIAQDASSSLQSAFNEGIVAGGGAFELSLIPHLKVKRSGIKNLSSYGVDCLIEALKRPMAQIITNAGFNPLEKIEIALGTHQEKKGFWGIDCDSGELVDMLEKGILDPAGVKKHALISAREVAQSILKINTIIRMKSQQNYQ